MMLDLPNFVKYLKTPLHMIAYDINPVEYNSLQPLQLINYEIDLKNNLIECDDFIPEKVDSPWAYGFRIYALDTEIGVLEFDNFGARFDPYRYGQLLNRFDYEVYESSQKPAKYINECRSYHVFIRNKDGSNMNMVNEYLHFSDSVMITRPELAPCKGFGLSAITRGVVNIRISDKMCKGIPVINTTKKLLTTTFK